MIFLITQMSSKDTSIPEKPVDHPVAMNNKHLDRLIQQEALAQAKYNTKNVGMKRRVDSDK